MNKGAFSNLLRKLRLLYPADYFRYHLSRIRNHSNNKVFLRKNPGIILPPDYLMYESFRLDYRNYYEDGLEAARWLTGLLGKHRELQSLNILDWGCGPGRIVRHLPGLLGDSSKVFGTDYNEKSVEWCRSALPEIEFNLNTASAILPYGDGFFGAIYGLSVITHLSEENHFNWINELLRVLEPGGLLLLSSQGNNFRQKLTPSELEKYDRGELIVRGNVKEGHRTYSAFQPEKFMNSLFAGNEILEHIVKKPENGLIPQDVWIVRKNKP